MQKHKPSFIESIAEKLGLIENLHPSFHEEEPPRINEPGELSNYPPPEKWDDWTEYEATCEVEKNVELKDFNEIICKFRREYAWW